MSQLNTVYLTYRHDTCQFIARAIYHALREHGYEIYMDTWWPIATSQRIIESRIKARAHLLYLVTNNRDSGDLYETREVARYIGRNLLEIRVYDLATVGFDYWRYDGTHRIELEDRSPCTNASKPFDAAIDGLLSQLRTFDRDIPIISVPSGKQAIAHRQMMMSIDVPTSEQLKAEQYLNQGVFLEYVGIDSNKSTSEQGKAAHTQAIAIFPNYAAAYFRRTDWWRGRIFDEEILSDIDTAIKLEPYIAEYYIRRAKINVVHYLDYAKALADYNEAIRQNPHCLRAYMLRASLFDFHLKDYDKAEEAYSELIRLDPYQPEHYRNRGLVRLRKGDHTGALADMDSAVSLPSRLHHQARLLMSRGSVCAEVGDRNGALADWAEAIFLTPEWQPIYNHRIHFLEIWGEYEAAIADYNTLIRLAPANAAYFRSRGTLKLKTGDYDAAIADFDQVLVLWPEDKTARHLREEAVRARDNRNRL